MMQRYFFFSLGASYYEDYEVDEAGGHGIQKAQRIRNVLRGFRQEPS